MGQLIVFRLEAAAAGLLWPIAILKMGRKEWEHPKIESSDDSSNRGEARRKHVD